jgi:hypothetical protein
MGAEGQRVLSENRRGNLEAVDVVSAKSSVDTNNRGKGNGGALDRRNGQAAANA